MKKVVKYAMISWITAVSLFSCQSEPSSDVNQDKIYVEYELFYDKNQDKTYASAIFKFSNASGTQLKLDSPAEIKFNNEVIPYDQTFAYYRKEYAGLVTTGTFSYKDLNGNVYTNTATLAAEISNPDIDTISRDDAFTYSWGGTSLGANETIGLVIGNTINTGNFQVFLQNSVQSTSLVLPLSQLNQLPVGSAYTQLDRQIETNATQATSVGGKVRGKYRGINKTLYID